MKLRFGLLYFSLVFVLMADNTAAQLTATAASRLIEIARSLKIIKPTDEAQTQLNKNMDQAIQSLQSTNPVQQGQAVDRLFKQQEFIDHFKPDEDPAGAPSTAPDSDDTYEPDKDFGNNNYIDKSVYNKSFEQLGQDHSQGPPAGTEDMAQVQDYWKKAQDGSSYPNLTLLYKAAIAPVYGKGQKNKCYRAVKHMLYMAGCLPKGALAVGQGSAKNFIKYAQGKSDYFDQIQVPEAKFAPNGAILVYTASGKTCAQTMANPDSHGHIEVKSPNGYHHFVDTKTPIRGRILCGAFMPKKCGSYN